MSIIVVLKITGFRPSAGRNVFLTSFSLFRRVMNRMSWALQACAEVRACDHTPLRERLAFIRHVVRLRVLFLGDYVPGYLKIFGRAPECW